MFIALPFPSEIRWPGSMVALGRKSRGLHAVWWALLCAVSSLHVRNCAPDTLLEWPQLTASPSLPLGIVSLEHLLCAAHFWRWGRGQACQGLLWASGKCTWAPCAQALVLLAPGLCSLGTVPQVCLYPSWVSPGSPAPLTPAVVLALNAPGPRAAVSGLTCASFPSRGLSPRCSLSTGCCG